MMIALIVLTSGVRVRVEHVSGVWLDADEESEYIIFRTDRGESRFRKYLIDKMEVVL